eukprot:TRINITY_DN1996_c0_g1_i4.p1 TRINITY_DN1996_c0_g1~~TRINITY_DN1996_c0_g1_i4.p1  ORF type:complete len:737 (+),score=206.75 TRINITY_DN1996_c0_g1_i4:22-2211(+)
MTAQVDYFQTIKAPTTWSDIVEEEENLHERLQSLDVQPQTNSPTNFSAVEQPGFFAGQPQYYVPQYYVPQYCATDSNLPQYYVPQYYMPQYCATDSSLPQYYVPQYYSLDPAVATSQNPTVPPMVPMAFYLMDSIPPPSVVSMSSHPPSQIMPIVTPLQPQIIRQPTNKYKKKIVGGKGEKSLPTNRPLGVVGFAQLLENNKPKAKAPKPKPEELNRQKLVSLFDELLQGGRRFSNCIFVDLASLLPQLSSHTMDQLNQIPVGSDSKFLFDLLFGQLPEGTLIVLLNERKEEKKEKGKPANKHKNTNPKNQKQEKVVLSTHKHLQLLCENCGISHLLNPRKLHISQTSPLLSSSSSVSSLSTSEENSEQPQQVKDRQRFLISLKKVSGASSAITQVLSEVQAHALLQCTKLLVSKREDTSALSNWSVSHPDQYQPQQIQEIVRLNQLKHQEKEQALLLEYTAKFGADGESNERHDEEMDVVLGRVLSWFLKQNEKHLDTVEREAQNIEDGSLSSSLPVHLQGSATYQEELKQINKRKMKVAKGKFSLPATEDKLENSIKGICTITKKFNATNIVHKLTSQQIVGLCPACHHLCLDESKITKKEHKSQDRPRATSSHTPSQKQKGPGEEEEEEMERVQQILKTHQGLPNTLVALHDFVRGLEKNHLIPPSVVVQRLKEMGCLVPFEQKRKLDDNKSSFFSISFDSSSTRKITYAFPAIQLALRSLNLQVE